MVHYGVLWFILSCLWNGGICFRVCWHIQKEWSDNRVISLSV
jgi:hypothetical protein